MFQPLNTHRLYNILFAMVITQSVFAFTLHAEGWMLESQPRQTETGNDSSTAKRLATGVIVTGPRR